MAWPQVYGPFDDFEEARCDIRLRCPHWPHSLTTRSIEALDALRRMPEAQVPSQVQAMELNGALLNRALLESLRCSGDLARRLVQLPPKERAEHRLPRRSGVVRNAVFRVLAAAEGPLRAREIHAAAEALAGEPLAWNTVKDCLHTGAGTTGVPIERVRHGWYRHA
jgi:hypothetical protein